MFHIPVPPSLMSTLQVIVVGNVRQKTVTPNQIAYKLDDGSGCIMARFWRDPTLEQDFVDDDITRCVLLISITAKWIKMG